MRPDRARIVPQSRTFMLAKPNLSTNMGYPGLVIAYGANSAQNAMMACTTSPEIPCREILEPRLTLFAQPTSGRTILAAPTPSRAATRLTKLRICIKISKLWDLWAGRVSGRWRYIYSGRLGEHAGRDASLRCIIDSHSGLNRPL